MFVKSLLSVASPSGRHARLSILIFHRVLQERDPLFPEEVDILRFDQIMSWVSSWFNVLPLDEAVQRLKTSSLPARAAAITFDDGYADNLLNAVPILKKYGLSATFFIATGFLDGGRMWNDTLIESIRLTAAESIDLRWLGLQEFSLVGDERRRLALDSLIPEIKHLPGTQRDDAVARIAADCRAVLPDDLMLTSLQLRALRDEGMGVGAHTITHPILARCTLRQAEEEIAGGRDALEAILGVKVPLFAYPNGKLRRDYTPEHVELVKRQGFSAAVSTNWGVSDMTSDLYQLRRFTPWDERRIAFGLRLARQVVVSRLRA